MWRNIKPYVLVLPAFSILTLLFLGGMMQGFVESLGYEPIIGKIKFSFEAYQQLLTSSDFWDSLRLSLRLSCLSATLSGIMGILMATCLFWLGARRSRSSTFLFRVLGFPLLIPHMVAAYLVILLFMQSGLIARFAFHLGWIRGMESFPVVVNDPLGWGILFTYIWKETPFVVLMIYPVFKRVHSSWFEVAQMLGADRFQFMKEIAFPLIVPAWISAVFIVMAFTFSSFEVPFLLGVTYPKALPVYAYELFQSGGLSAHPQALAANVLLVLITICLGAVAYWVSRRWILEEGRGWE